jgi:hypothetical protein
MSFYIGRQPVTKAARNRKDFALSSGQTEIIYSYVPGFVDVYLNGQLLDPSDYTATSGTSIVLDEAAVTGDTATCVSYSTFESANHHTKAEADLRYQQIDNLLGYRNVIVDGDMTSWQEGASKTGLTASTYVSDVHKLGLSGSGTWTAQQVADHPLLGANGYCYEALCTAADTTVEAGAYGMFNTFVEGSAYAALYQKTQTISFWVKSNVTGIYSVSLRNGGADRTYVAEITINAANAWEQKTVTITATPSGGTWYFDNRIGLNIALTLVCGSTFQAATKDAWVTGSFLGTASNVNLAAALNNYLRITDVQLEKGDKATPFERLGPGEQLRRCMRYIYVLPRNASGYAYPAMLQAYTTAAAYGSISILSMREDPIVSFSGTYSRVGNGTGVTLSAVTIIEANRDHVRVKAEGSFSAGFAYELRADADSTTVFGARF